MSYALTQEIHQVLDPEGNLVAEPPPLSAEEQLALYRWMVFGRAFSDRMVALQRQGRMGTFAPHTGQEASAGIASPLESDDWLIASYRELIAYFVKGVPPIAVMETHKGYFGKNYRPETHTLPVQVVLATQMLHAVGVAMALAYEGKPNVAVGVCGDGATSEGDFNEALNFAGVFRAPFVAVVQNNQWAISTPRSRQTAAAFIAHRGPAFGMPGYVVDGNDVLAVHKVVGDCVARARAGDGPSLVELLTYRLGPHTTADDPTKYRSEEEVQHWLARDPIRRFRLYLLAQDLLSDEEDEAMHEAITAEIQQIVEEFEATPPPEPTEIFEHVFGEMTPQLVQQQEEVRRG